MFAFLFEATFIPRRRAFTHQDKVIFRAGLDLMIKATVCKLEQVYLWRALDYIQQFFQYFGVLCAVESFLTLSRLPKSDKDCFRPFWGYKSNMVDESRLAAEQIYDLCLDYNRKLCYRIRPEPHRNVASKHCKISIVELLSSDSLVDSRESEKGVS